MFLSEARLAATLDHPNIVHVTDIGEVQGEPFFVMEYVHGQDVRAIMRAAAKTQKRLPISCALTIAMGIATGLHYVHERRGPDGRFLGLVHRDVSPANVVVSYDGSVKLVDFGIAKATEQRQSTRSGVLKGKVNYMAPEQCHGVNVDRRTDVFALGILLYEMTTGKRLFAGDSDFYVMSRIVRGLFARPTEVRPDYPPELEAIVLRALSTDPDARHATAQELLADIEGFAHEHRLRLSGLAVAEFLRDLFGEQPHPGSDDADELPTMIHPDSPGSGPRGSGPEIVRPTAVSESPETTTTMQAVSESPETTTAMPAISESPETTTTMRAVSESDAISGETTTTILAVTPGAIDAAATPSEPTRRLEPHELSPVLKTEPSPRVILPAAKVRASTATEPSPRVQPLALPRAAAPQSRRNRHIALVIGLAVATVIAFAIGMSAGSRDRSVASPAPERSREAQVGSDASPLSAPAGRTDEAPPQPSTAAIESPAPEASKSEHDAVPRPTETPTRADPTPKTTKAPAKTPTKKKRSADKASEPAKPSGLDAMYPSSSRSGPLQARDRE
jgi:serine/threonine protein kinase